MGGYGRISGSARTRVPVAGDPQTPLAPPTRSPHQAPSLCIARTDTRAEASHAASPAHAPRATAAGDARLARERCAPPHKVAPVATTPFAAYAHIAFEEELPIRTPAGRRGFPLLAASLAVVLLLPALAGSAGAPPGGAGAGAAWGRNGGGGAGVRVGPAAQYHLLAAMLARPHARPAHAKADEARRLGHPLEVTPASLGGGLLGCLCL
jgi:hypothetical protein